MLRGDFVAPLAPFAVDRVDPDPADLARDVDAFFAPPLARDAVERLAVELFAAPLLERFAVEREAVDLRAPPDRPELLVDVDEPELEELALVPGILPDRTRCAASATASAMIDPSLVALAVKALAACDAVSAASSPASRIFLRAAGLAAIAAAAAVRPAASISLLIAAFASLSTVLSFELEREPEDEDPERDFAELDLEELLRADFAIFNLPRRRGKTL